MEHTRQSYIRIPVWSEIRFFKMICGLSGIAGEGGVPFQRRDLLSRPGVLLLDYIVQYVPGIIIYRYYYFLVD